MLMRWIGRLVAALAIAAALVPVGFFATILLLPLWRLVESGLGIEAIGHFGPAEWCFALVYAALAAAAVVLWWRAGRRPG